MMHTDKFYQIAGTCVTHNDLINIKSKYHETKKNDHETSPTSFLYRNRNS